MPSRIPDTALRRMIADLAALHAEDVSEILDDLGPVERRTVEDLLREYTGPFNVSVDVPVPVQADYEISRLSFWLVQRFETQSNGLDFRITAHTRETLRDCAARLYPASSGHDAPIGAVP